MQVALARRPVEQFDSELTLPEWQLEPDNEAYFGEPDNGMYVDENGMPLESEPGTETDMPAEPAEQTPETTTSPRLDQKWIDGDVVVRSEEHTSELQSLMRISYAVFCLKKKHKNTSKTREII